MVEKLRSRVAELDRHAHKRKAIATKSGGKLDSLPACHQGVGSPVSANIASENGLVLARYDVKAVATSGPSKPTYSRADEI